MKSLVGGWMNGWMDELFDWWVDRILNGRMNIWMNGWMVE